MGTVTSLAPGKLLKVLEPPNLILKKTEIKWSRHLLIQRKSQNLLLTEVFLKRFMMPKKSYQKSARSYAVHPGMEMEHNPVPKIRAFNRRILKVIEQMPEDYVYRTTVQGLIEEQAALVDQFQGDIALLEEKIGAPMEMHIRSLKRELRAARGLVEEQAWGELFASAPADQWKWPI